MRGPKTEEDQNEIRIIYGNIEKLIKAYGIKWKDLALLIGVSPRTLSTMKNTNQNPGATSLIKIADALECSVDELCYDGYVTEPIKNLEWNIRRLFPEEVKCRAVCESLTNTAYILAGVDGSKEPEREADNARIVKQKIDKAESKSEN